MEKIKGDDVKKQKQKHRIVQTLNVRRASDTFRELLRRRLVLTEALAIVDTLIDDVERAYDLECK